MTEIIALCASVIMLMFFPLQYTNEQVNYHHISEARDRIEESVEVAKQEGCFTSTNQNALKTDLAALLDVDESKIQLQVPGSPVYRGTTYANSGIIEYKITFPVENYLAMNEMWGIDDADNILYYPVKGRVASERINPI